MTLGNARSGPGLVSEYQVSGLPYATASNAAAGTPARIDFPFVTQNVYVKNPGGGAVLRVGFTANGVGGSNYVSLPASASWSSDIRIETLFIASTTGTTPYEVQAALTMVDTREFPVLTGSAGLVATTGSFGYVGLG